MSENLYKNLFLRALTIIFFAPIYFHILYISNLPIYVCIFVLIYFILIQKEWSKLSPDKDMGIVIFTIPFISVLMMRIIHRIYPCIYFLCVWSSDAFAMIGGTIFKGPTLTDISPRKTWTGIFTGMLGSIISLSLFFSVDQCILYGFIISVSGQLGDIYMSYYKRKAGVKDTGRVLPGHGGLIDRFDSSIISAPLFWLLIQN